MLRCVLLLLRLSVILTYTEDSVKVQFDLLFACQFSCHLNGFQINQSGAAEACTQTDINVDFEALK